MKYLVLLLLMVFCFAGSAQVYLQLEIFNDPKALKYSVGDHITYQTYYDPGQWNRGEIQEIMVKENTIVLDNAILRLEDATGFMLYRNSVKYLGGTMQTFGIIWLAQGAIAATFGRNTSWKTVLGIGGGSWVGGWLFRKLFYKIPINLNEKNRLRIIDTRFSIPDKS
ncbi:hypothetical protein [Portibacter marinus]|uniref:hypothetical protein n=1 Tax=Portibacter marinus TaxID=2898660 RepID=UPI001F3A6CE4|nr:hypothetical protein [Portibacter marinus]